MTERTCDMTENHQLVRYEVKFSVDFLQAWQRAGTNHRTRTHFTQRNTRDAEKQIAIAYKGASIRKYGRVVKAPKGVPVAFMIEAYKKEPKEYPGYLPKWIYPRIPFVVKPDDDNISKIKDSLNGVAWDDDSQVTASHTFKRDRNGVTHDRTAITIQFDLEE